MKQSFNIVQQLATDFAANEKAYLAQSYSESQVRQDFIDKFFTALGWDVTHSVQKNPYEQEVKIENRVTMADSQRRADYAFSIAPNFEQVKFFVEAKKPSRSLANPDDYFQTIRYAWNTRIPIAVLTDFEEFHILDCRHKPNIKNALDRKIAEFRYTDYQKEELFAKIFHLFGRDAVAAGSLEKYAASLPKKGKKIPGTMQLVDDAFLEELDSYREILAKAFKKTNEALQGDELTEAVQRTIDRLVFIRFLEDKGIEDKQIVSIADPKSAWKAFVNLCKRLEPKYNGLVFKPHRILDSGEFNAPDGAPFAGICQKIADPSSPYDFNQIPISILGSIYERFLGKVVHATDKRVKVEEKPEVRKAGGVYYTPEYIVKYIVKETVGKLIDGKPPEQIASMAFADIACGSGSFLIEVYAQVLEYHLQYYTNHPEAVGKDVLFERNGVKYLTLKKKKEILLNNIYGVDIDFQATEVTQLSLYLKMLENATMNDAHQFGLFKETILPDLRQNIICGNSLIGRDILEGELFSTIDEGKLKPMNYEDAFPKIMKKGGFDAVVGNPPYVDIKGLPKNEVNYIFNRYQSSNNRINLFAAFIEKVLSILNTSKSRFSYIVPTALLTQDSYKALRIKILQNQRVYSLVRLPNESFGKSAGDVKVDTVIFVFGDKDKEIYQVEVIGYSGYDRISSINSSEAHVHEYLGNAEWLKNEDVIWNISGKSLDNGILSKCEKDSIALEECVTFSLGLTPYDKYKGHTKKQIETKCFHANYEKDKSYKKLLAGNDVMRYYVKWNGNQWISYGPWLGAAREKKYFTEKRILVKQIIDWSSKTIWAALVEEELYNSQNAFNLIKKTDYDLEFILAIINSKLMNYYHQKKYLDAFKMRFQKILIKDCKRFPIHKIHFDDTKSVDAHNYLVALVNQMNKAKSNLMIAKTESEINRLELLCASLDRKIDEAVYELYGLTEEEVAIVEGSL